MTMRSFWYNARQAATHLCELTGCSVLPEELPELLSEKERAGCLGGIPLMQGKLYGPMALRTMHAKLLAKRKTYLMQESHAGRPPLVMSHYAKGGSGKTTAIVNAAIALAQKGMKVLFIDADPQSSATDLFGIDCDDESIRTLIDLVPFDVKPKCSMADAIIPLMENGVLDLIASDPLLGGFDVQAHHMRGGRDRLIEKMLVSNAQMLKNYDVILVDTNPSTSSPLNFVLAVAADTLLMSISMDALSMKSRRMMDSLFVELQDVGAKTKVLVLANAFAPATTHGRQSLTNLVVNDRQHLMKTVIPFSAAVARQGGERKPGGGLSVIEREPNSPVARKYGQFALELMEYALWQSKGFEALEFEAHEIDAIEAGQLALAA